VPHTRSLEPAETPSPTPPRFSSGPLRDVRFWHKADAAIALNDVRFRHIADMVKRTSVNAALMSDEVLK
jgi:hypothetical protein